LNRTHSEAGDIHPRIPKELVAAVCEKLPSVFEKYQRWWVF